MTMAAAHVAPARAHAAAEQLLVDLLPPRAHVATRDDSARGHVIAATSPGCCCRLLLLLLVILVELLRAHTRALFAPPAACGQLDGHRHGELVDEVTRAVPIVQVDHEAARHVALTQLLPRPKVERLLAKVGLRQQHRRGGSQLRSALAQQRLEAVDDARAVAVATHARTLIDGDR